MNFSSVSILLSKRIDIGSHSSCQLRKNNKIPAILYSNKISLPVFLDKKDSVLILKMISCGFNLIKLKLEDEEFLVVVKDIQEHVYKSDILHFDFQKVELSDRVFLKVFLKFCGEKNSPGIKQGGFLIKQMSSVFIKCLVSDIPDYIYVDLSNLDVNQSMFLSDIVLPKNICIPVLERKKKVNCLVASIIAARKSETVKVETK